MVSAHGDNCLLFVSLNLVDDPPTTGAEYLWFLSSKDHEEVERQAKGESRGIEWMEAELSKSQEQHLQDCLDLTKEFAEPLKGIISETDDQIFPIFLREVKLERIPTGRVTLLGDAAHAMSICKFMLSLSYF